MIMQDTETYKPSILLRIPAKIISYVFHPLFIPTYIFIFLMFQFPTEFSGITLWKLKMRFFGLFWFTAFFPAFIVFLLWRLKFSESIYLRTQKDRIIPFFVTMFFYWWMYYLSRNFTDQPIVLKFFYFGIFISTSFGVIINNYIKISLHAMAMGAASAAMVLFAFYYHIQITSAISITFLLTGIVCSSRLIASDHTNAEIYIGLFVGIICQLIGYWFAI